MVSRKLRANVAVVGDGRSRTVAEAFDPAWTGEEGKRRVIVTLIRLPIPRRQKKQALFEWCRTHDVEMTAADVERVTGRPAGEM